MDKTKLWYIVDSGSNIREITHGEIVIFQDEKRAQKRATRLSSVFEMEHETISIAEYEETFLEKKEPEEETEPEEEESKK